MLLVVVGVVCVCVCCQAANMAIVFGSCGDVMSACIKPGGRVG